MTASLAMAAETESPAQVTLSVTQFRDIRATTAGTRWTDARASLTAHPSVRMSGEPEYATFHVKGAVDIAISVTSASSAESYVPIAIVFQQKTPGDPTKADTDGRRNFSAATLNGSTLTVRNRCDLRGVRYEFFVVIQRVSDGAIGIIDPEIENEIPD